MQLRSRKRVKVDHAEADMDPSSVASTSSTPHDADPEPSTSSATTALAKKRQPAGKAKKKGIVKSYFMELPPDMMIEICKYLHPRDLCALIRTCRGMRDLLLKRNVKETVWNAVFRHAKDLPPRPKHMSLPAFSHYLFTSFCRSCGANVRQVHLHAWFAKYCSKCLPLVTYSHNEAEEMLARALTGVTVGWHVRNQWMMYVSPNVDPPTYDDDNRIIEKDDKHCRILKTEVDALLTTVQRIAQMELPEGAHKNARELLEREAIKRHIVDNKALKEAGEACATWFEYQEAAKLNAQRKQRFADILQKLRESGWSEEVEFLSKSELKRLEEMPIMARSTKLTHNEWLKVRREVKGFMEDTRAAMQAARLKAERLARITSRLGALEEAILIHYGIQVPRNAEMDRRFNFLVFAYTEECFAIIDAPATQVVTLQDFIRVVADVATRWEAAVTEEATRILRSFKGYVAEDVEDVFGLATAVFMCSECPKGSGPMRFRDALFHECTRGRCRMRPHEETAQELLRISVLQDGLVLEEQAKRAARRLFDPDSHSFHVLNPMHHILKALGLDSKRASVQELVDVCQGRLRCLDCVQQGKNRVYAWDAAMDHSYRTGTMWTHSTWRAVGNATLAQVHKIEAAVPYSPLKSPSGVWVCSLCADWIKVGSHTVTHLKEEHGIIDPEECVRDGRVYLHPTMSSPTVRPGITLPVPHPHPHAQRPIAPPSHRA